MVCGLVQGYVVMFEDLPLTQQYIIGNSFSSDGVEITCTTYDPGATAFAIVQADGDAGGTGNEIWLNNISLDFAFPIDPLYGLSLQYGEYGGDVIFEINGDLHGAAGFSALHGTMVGGVMVTVVDIGDKGAIFATGPISSFSIGGNELAIDNIIACIPEPATLALLGLGALVLLRRKK